MLIVTNMPLNERLSKFATKAPNITSATATLVTALLFCCFICGNFLVKGNNIESVFISLVLCIVPVATIITILTSNIKISAYIFTIVCVIFCAPLFFIYHDKVKTIVDWKSLGISKDVMKHSAINSLTLAILFNIACTIFCLFLIVENKYSENEILVIDTYEWISIVSFCITIIVLISVFGTIKLKDHKIDEVKISEIKDDKDSKDDSNQKVTALPVLVSSLILLIPAILFNIVSLLQGSKLISMLISILLFFITISFLLRAYLKSLSLEEISPQFLLVLLCIAIPLNITTIIFTLSPRFI